METKKLKELTNWYIQFPKKLLFDSDLTRKELMLAIEIYYQAHGNSTTMYKVNGKKVKSRNNSGTSNEFSITSDFLFNEHGIRQQHISSYLKNISKEIYYKNPKTNETTYFIQYESKRGRYEGGYKFKVKYAPKTYVLIPDFIFNKYKKTSPEMVINYAKLRYACWYCSYGNGELTNDKFRIAKEMGLSGTSELNKVLKQLEDEGLINATNLYFDDEIYTMPNEPNEELYTATEEDDMIFELIELTEQANIIIEELKKKNEELSNRVEQLNDENTKLRLENLELHEKLIFNKEPIKETQVEIKNDSSLLEELKTKIPTLEEKKELFTYQEETIEEIEERYSKNNVPKNEVKKPEYKPGIILPKEEIKTLIKDDFIGYGGLIRQQGWNCDTDLISPTSESYQVYKNISNRFLNAVKKWYDYEYSTGDILVLQPHMIEPFYIISTIDETIFQTTLVDKFENFRRQVKNKKMPKEIFKFIMDKLTIREFKTDYIREDYNKVMNVLISKYNSLGE